MIDDKEHVKIIDLGSCELFYKERYMIIGPPQFLEPQLLVEGKKYTTDKTDIWSLGITILYLHSPYFNDEFDKMYIDVKYHTGNEEDIHMIDAVEKVKMDKIKEYDNPLCQFIFDKMLIYDRDKRAGIQEVIDFVSE